MRRHIVMLIVGLTMAAVVQGCTDDTPPPRRVPVPSSASRDFLLEREFYKPLPPLDWREARNDAPASTRPN